MLLALFCLLSFSISRKLGRVAPSPLILTKSPLTNSLFGSGFSPPPPTLTPHTHTHTQAWVPCVPALWFTSGALQPCRLSVLQARQSLVVAPLSIAAGNPEGWAVREQWLPLQTWTGSSVGCSPWDNCAHI